MTAFRSFFLSVMLVSIGCQTTQSKPASDLKAATPMPAEQKVMPMARTAEAVFEASGAFQCFPAGTLKEEGKMLTCEPSGALFLGDSILVASDKSTVGDELSPVFSLSVQNMHPQPVPQTYALESVFKTTRKIEDLTSSADGQWGFATTGFDRYREDKASWDAYNTFLYWPKNNLAVAGIANETQRESVRSSVSLRTAIQKAMSSSDGEGPAYYKIEGLVALPDNTLLFGVRERGVSFKDFRYTLTLLKTTYQVDNGVVVLSEDFQEAYRFQPDEEEGLPKATGLSSLTYDPHRRRLILLTSYESAASHAEIGSFLWSLSLESLSSRAPPEIMKDEEGKPFLIPHKGEAVVMVDADHLLVLHDDDRVTRTKEESTQRPGAHPRAIHQGVWSLIGLF